jgi:hypothetical protein
MSNPSKSNHKTHQMNFLGSIFLKSPALTVELQARLWTDERV